MGLRRNLRSRMLVSGAMAALLASACYADTEDTGEESAETGEADSEFTVNESGNNTPASASAIRNVDDGSAFLGANDPDYWVTVARPGDEIYAVVLPTTTTTGDTFLEIFTDLNTTTSIFSDDASGPSNSSVIAGESVPGSAELVYYLARPQNLASTTAIGNYRLFHYIADDIDDQLESANNNTAATADTILAPVVEGNMGGTDVDYWGFEAAVGDEIVVICDDDADDNGNVDTTIEVRDSADVVMTSPNGVADNNSGNEYNSTGIYTVATAGTHYLRVSWGNIGQPGDYRCVVLLNGRPPVALGPMPESAGETITSFNTECVKSQHSAEGFITATSDDDVYRMIGRPGDRIYFYVDTQQSTPSSDSEIFVTNDVGTNIEIDDAGGPGAGSVVAGAIATTVQTYIRINEDNQDSTMSDYHVYPAIVAASDVANEITPESNATLATADDFTATRMRGNFTSTADTDHWRIPARAGDNIVVIVDDDPDDASGPTVDSNIEILDPNGVVLATGDNGFNSGNAAGPVEAFVDGVYFARITNGSTTVSDNYEIVAIVTNGPVVCGDGDLDGVEACDDGNTTTGDGCDDRCAVEAGFNCTGEPSVCTATCGDGQVVGNEGCDDGNTTAGDGCDANCAVETGYQCMGAPSMCSELCGDGQIVGNEGCDDGNTMAGDGCDAACAVETGFQCMGTPSTCAEICGDGQIVGNEGCDDGNTMAGDGCDAACAVETGYQCMGAPSTCAEVCGDGQIVGNEGCDDGNATAGDGCDAACAVETGYQCMGTPSVCAEICGDGAIVGNEGCDDGNMTAGDGCSDTCAVEMGYSCMGEPSVCTANCGDGQIDGSEACDDGNTAAGDGCDATCMVEMGYMCNGEPSACDTVCGDNIVAGSEECDDGNTTDGDGCSSMCTNESTGVGGGAGTGTGTGTGTGGGATSGSGGSGGDDTVGEDGGCSCRVVGGEPSNDGDEAPALLSLFGLAVAMRRRRKRA